jgi:hypothetical protein
MAIVVREVEGVLVALCAVEIDPKMGDLYLDDSVHYALAAKFARDWQGRLVNWEYGEENRLAETQKVRDAGEELQKWFDNGCPEESGLK